MLTTRTKILHGEAEAWTRSLATNTTMHLRRRLRARLLRVERGKVVVTREGDRKDYVLLAGEEMVLPGAGLVVAWALEPSQVSGRAFHPPHTFHLGPSAGAMAGR